MKKISGRIANLTPEQREKLLKKLKEKKNKGELSTDKSHDSLQLKGFVNSNEKLPLSFAQQRLWFLENLEQGRAIYNIPASLRLKGDLDLKILERCFFELIKRHTSLRTTFIAVDGIPEQRIHAESSFSIPFKDLSDLSQEQAEEEAYNLAAVEAVKPFSLDKGPLLRTRLLKVSENDHVLLICLHHIISDAWSMGILVREISFFYEAVKRNQNPKLPDLSLQYTDFAAWQRHRIEQGQLDKQVQYWKQKLEGLEALNFPCDYPRPVSQSFVGREVSFCLNESLTKALKNIAIDKNKTLFMVLLASWKVLLYRYSGQKDICVGTPIANRNHGEIENLIGFFVNSLAIRTEIDPEQSFYKLLDSVQETTIAAYANQDIPFEQVIDELGIERDMSQSPIFQNFFTFHNKPVAEELSLSGMSVKLEPIHTQTAKFDLSINLVDEGDAIKGQIEFNTDLFDEKNIIALSNNYISLLESVVRETDSSLSDLSCLNEEDEEKLLNQWNKNQQNFEKDLCIHQQFEKQVQLSPKSIAVKCGANEISYERLNADANQFARYLQGGGVKAGDTVGLYVDRSSELIVALLATIKLGAKYLPLDPAYPKERIKLLIDNAQLTNIVSRKEIWLKETVELVNTAVNIFYVEDKKRWNGLEKINLDINFPSDSLLYEIYTSGSTGIPKRTGAYHFAESNLCAWYSEQMGMRENHSSPSKILLISALGFDLTQKNIFASLLNGVCIVIPESSIYDANEIVELIATENIKLINCAPSAFYPLVSHTDSLVKLSSLRKVCLGGESIASEKLVNWLSQSHCELINSYGPTECTDVACYYKVKDISDFRRRPIPIGQASNNAELFILDEHLNPLPIGVIGELYIGGVGLGPGYFNDQEATEKSFIENPLPGKNGKLYATGDLAKYLRSGDIEYIGRKDDQIKIRGYRVEVAEISSLLLDFESVLEAAVVSHKQASGQDVLIAYFVSANPDIEKSGIRKYLKEKLPDFMVPAALVQLNQLPLTPNGKLDKKALVIPPLDSVSQSEFLAPRNQIEDDLVQIWQEVLAVETIGVNDNYFELGGDSILSMQIVSRAAQKGIVISAAELFKYQNIAELSLIAKEGEVLTAAEQGHIRGQVGLNYAQRWFFAQNYDHVNYYNQSILLNLKSTLSLDDLKLLTRHLIEQHDGLNLIFKRSDNDQQWALSHTNEQFSDGTIAALVEEVEAGINRDDIDTIRPVLELAQTKLSIESGKLFHGCLINHTDKTQSLYLIAHHLIVDGVSWRILLEDINHLFIRREGLLGIGERELLGHKTHSLKYCGQVIDQMALERVFENDKGFWLNQAEQIENYRDDFLEHSQKQEQESCFKHVKRLNFNLSKTLTDKFLKQANRAFRTNSNELLISALALSFAELNSQVNSSAKELLLSLEGHGRDFNSNIDVSRTVGWFTSLFPVLLHMEQEQDQLGRHIKAIKEQLRNIPNKGNSYAYFKYPTQENSISQFLRGVREPNIVFNYLGQFDASVTSPHFSIDTRREYRVLEQAPEMPRSQLLDVIALVHDGCLQCDILYSETQFDEETISLLSHTFVQQLENIIEYCCQQSLPSLSPSDVPAAYINQTEIELIEAEFARKSWCKESAIENIYRLSPTQEGMLFHTLFNGEVNSKISESGVDNTYFEQLSIRLEGNIDKDTLTQAWQGVCDANPVLRSAFYWEFDKPLQVVLKHYPFDIEFLDWQGEADFHNKLETFLSEDRLRQFNLDRLPLMRFTLIKENEGSFWFAWRYHHILLDGWSVPLVLTQLLENYKTIDSGHSQLAPSVGINYENYIHQLYEEKLVEKDLEYWRSYLQGFSNPNAIELEPLAYPITPEEGENLAEEVARSLGSKLTKGLKQFSKDHHFTLNTLFQAAWALLLHHYSSDEDVVFGATVSGRSQSILNAENIVGVFINTLPFRVRFNEALQIEQLLTAIQTTQTEVLAHQLTPLVKIQKLAGINEESSLFNSILVFENFPVDEALNENTDLFKVGEMKAFERTNYPLTISIVPSNEFKIKVLFDNSLYRKETIERLVGHFEHLLESFIAADALAKNIYSIDYLSNEERNQLAQWNVTQSSYPRDENIVGLVERNAKMYPDQLAIKFPDHELSYSELLVRINQASHFLSNRDVKRGDRVGICLDRSVDMIVMTLASLKLGAAYVPLDPDYPEERLSFMLEDSSPVVIATLHSNANLLESLLNKISKDGEAFTCEIISVDQEREVILSQDKTFPQEKDLVLPTDVAYIMYTSGSTGRPKGVCINHRAIIRLVVNSWYLTIGPKDRVAHIGNVSFDASTYEIWAALLNGASLIGIPKETVLSETAFAEAIEKESITNMLVTTALFHLYSKNMPEIFHNMRCLLVGGEAVHPDSVRRVLENSRPLRLMNMYGPTENGVITTGFDTWNLPENAKNTPVGKPISNTTAYIVDQRGKEVPVGVVGELASGGDGLANAYLNLPETTERAFKINDDGERVYYTGDLARRLPDGNIELLGRKDDQVKIRGYRIEPSEIVSKVNQIEGIKNSVVIVHENDFGQKQLASYYVLEDEAQEIDSQFIREQLALLMPSQMIPSFFIEIDLIPITQNGKLDQEKLPKPFADSTLKEGFVKPRTENEILLAEIWSDALNISSVGINDNFFELGGDSILSIQIVSRAKRVGLSLNPRQIFEYPSIADLAANLNKTQVQVVAEQGLVSGEIINSPIQSWFFDNDFINKNHFNQSLLFELNDFLTIQSITPVVAALIKHHDILRARFSIQKGKWVQALDNSNRSLSSMVEIVSEKNLSMESDPVQAMITHANEMQTKLSIGDGPMIKFVLFHLGKQGQRLLIVAHHLIVDGVSWRILLEDIEIALEQQASNSPINLGEKTSSFQYYSKIHLDYLYSDLVNVDKALWLEKVQDLHLFFEKNAINATSKIEQGDLDRRAIPISSEKTQLLLGAANKAYRTDISELLLAALALAKARSDLGDYLWIEMEGHGRDTITGNYGETLDLSRTMGWFTNMYPVLIANDSDYSIEKYIKQSKESLRSTPNGGRNFLGLANLDSDHKIRQAFSALPRPEVSFNYLGQVHDDQNDRRLKISEEYVAQDNDVANKALYPLAVSAIVKNGVLELAFNYSRSVYGEKIDVLTTAIVSALDEVIDHCSQPENYSVTPSDIPYYSISQETIDALNDKHQQFEAIYPLSPMQEGMLFHTRLDSESGVYCEQVSVLFSHDLDIKRLEKAWNRVLQRHDILRTKFIWEDLEKPLQLVYKHASLNITELDWRDEIKTELKLKTFLENDRKLGFDFDQVPLMRIHCIETDDGKRIIWTYHHILLDGWSMPLLMREVFNLYNHYEEIDENLLDKPVKRYEDYVAWLYTNKNENADEFWRDYLAGYTEPCSLGIQENKYSSFDPNIKQNNFVEQCLQLDQEQTKQLQHFAKSHHLTLNTILQSVWAMLLHKYSGDEDIVFGITVSGRPSELVNVESIIGLFINTIPFRVKIDGDEAIADWMQAIMKEQIRIRQFESSPLVDIQSQSEIDRSRRLFDSIMVFENYPLDETLAQGPSDAELMDIDVYEQTNFPLSVIVLPGNTLEIRMLYDNSRFESIAIEKLIHHMKTLLLNLLSTEKLATTPLRQLGFLSEEEDKTILLDWNDTNSTYPRDDSLQSIVEKHAEQTPEQLALQMGNRKISYHELNITANCFANYLINKGVAPGDKVVVCLDRSIELIWSVLAILKVGAVYVPLDPSYPEERQRYMLEDTQTKCIVTDGENEALINHLLKNKSFRDSVSSINVDGLEKEIAQFSANNLDTTFKTSTPAAVLYTSGSTGQPKGVCLSHRGLMRMVMNTNYMELSESDKVAHVSNICFDAASFEIWCALLNGLTLVIVDKNTLLDLDAFEKTVKEQQVNVMLIITALFNMVAKENVDVFKGMKYVFFGGEACNVGMVKRVLEEAKPDHLLHMYGPSENSTYTTWFEVKEVSDDALTIPIGKPIANTKVYITNNQGDLVGEGVAGEIVTSGDGLALGYLNKPELSQSTFVTNPFAEKMEALGADVSKDPFIYKTGDLGRWLPDGNIEILGRIDDQVKIRGHRIEPEEINACLNKLDEVKKSVVLINEDNPDRKVLVAYFVPEDNADTTSPSGIRLSLRAVLPDYMMPHHFILIEELPLTANGKIDKRALPKPDLSLGGEERVTPQNDLERELLDVWQGVLERDDFGVCDDFFELGGHSLLVTQVHSRIRQNLGIDVPLRTLFELPTIRELAEFWHSLTISIGQDDASTDSEDDEDFEEGTL